MIPLLFGNKRHLYGVYHPAAGDGITGRGAVLVNPYLHETLRSHRAYRALADAMARNRWHVLRFDYYATGDSAGADDEMSVAGWLDDIDAAVDELKAIARVPRVTLIGLRLGAALAATAAERRDDVNALVLWEPVTHGRDYLDELGVTGEIARDIDVAGFNLAPDMAGAIAEIDVAKAFVAPPTETLMVVSDPDARHRALRDQWQAGDRFLYQHVEGPHAWTEENDFGAGPVPTAVIQSIASWRGIT